MSNIINMKIIKTKNYIKFAQLTETPVNPAEVPPATEQLTMEEANTDIKRKIGQLRARDPDIDRELNLNQQIEQDLETNPEAVEKMIADPSLSHQIVGQMAVARNQGKPFSIKDTLTSLGIDITFGAANWLLDIL